MSALSISSAWEATHQFVRREAALLLPVAFAFIGLPGIVIDLVRPVMVPGQEVQAGGWMLAIIPAWFALIYGSLVLSTLALSGGMSVRDALAHAARRLTSAVGVMLMLGFVVVILMTPVAAFVPGAAAGAPAAVPPGVGLYLMAIAVAAIVASIRFLLFNVALVAEEGGAVASLKRSWAMTRGQFWRLLGCMLIFVLATLVIGVAISVAAGSVLLIIGKALGDPALGHVLIAILSGAINAVLSTYLWVMLAMIYRQLSGVRSGM